MEKSRSWSSAHDWKSCRRQKRLEGSNPSFSATQKAHRKVCLFRVAKREEGFEGSVVNDCRWQSEPTTAPPAGGRIPPSPPNAKKHPFGCFFAFRYED